MYHDRNYSDILQPRLWVMWPSKSSASDGLLYVNCSVTNRTQICFQSTQVVDCLPGVWVLVLYWRPFYFFVVIVESLLHIYICLLFILFQVFCRLLWWFLHRRKCCWLQIPLWYVVFNKVCEIALSEVLTTQMGVMRFVSSFEMHKFDPFLPHSESIPWELVHSYVLGCLWIVTVCCNTVGWHGQSFLSTTRICIQWTI